MKPSSLLVLAGLFSLGAVAYAHQKPMPRDFFWIVVCETIMTAITAWGIGANDVANCFGTSVGSKSLKLWQAVIIASIFEFLGAFLLGSNVTDTVRSKIVDPYDFEDTPEVVMLGMFAADVATGTWLAIATWLHFPVSTTHSVVGAVIGFGMAAKGPDSVLWDKVGMVVLSWVTAPASSGVVAAIVFFLVRWLILRAENSFDRALRFYPVLVIFTVWINLFFMMYKGAPQLKKHFKNIEPYVGIWICLGVACCIGIPLGCILVPFLRKRINNRVASEEAMAADTENARHIEVPGVEKNADLEKEAVGNQDGSQVNKKGLLSSYHKDLHAEALNDGFLGAKAQKVHDAAEVFDIKTEYTFNWIQVVTACFDSFAHGANDVANAIGTLAATVGVYNANMIPDKKVPVPLWILALGGVMIGVGVATWGYKIIQTIGVQLTHITPSRGFCIEIASSLTVIVSSILGAPVSTTQVQVGATLGVGLVDGKAKGVNWWLFGKIFAGWALTLVVAGLFSAALTGAMLWSPSSMYEFDLPVATNTTR